MIDKSKVLSSYKTALITGATSGIGYSFARLLSSVGANLVLIARDEKKLSAVKQELEQRDKTKVFVMACDLANPENIALVARFLEENDVTPGLLINNAGAGLNSMFTETGQSKEMKIIGLNIQAPSELARLMIMKAQPQEAMTILFVSSTMAFRKSPGWAVYAATKSYILSLAGSLELEYRQTTVKVCVLCPGKTDTGFDLNAGVIKATNTKKDDPDEVAEYAVKKMLKGKRVIIPGMKNKLKYLLFRFFPAFVSDYLIGRL